MPRVSTSDFAGEAMLLTRFFGISNIEDRHN